MTRFGWLIVSGVALLLLILSGVLLLLYGRAAPSAPASEATVTPLSVEPSALSIYTSGQYGLSFFYPNTGELSDEFSTTTMANLPWRKNAVTQGTLVARVTTAGGEVRIGFSTAAKEIGACTKPGPAEKAISNFTNGSTTWSRFVSDSIGTDNQLHITSYRTVHDGSCYALESFVPFSSAQTATSSAPVFTPENIQQSFSFAGV